MNKQIEELASLLYCEKFDTPFTDCEKDIRCIDCIAMKILKQGYQKVEKDSVVLDRGDYVETLRESKTQAYEFGVKETAEKIYKLVDKKLDLYRNGVIGGSLYDSGYQTAIYNIKRIIKEQYGVEIKE